MKNKTKALIIKALREQVELTNQLIEEGDKVENFTPGLLDKLGSEALTNLDVLLYELTGKYGFEEDEQAELKATANEIALDAATHIESLVEELEGNAPIGVVCELSYIGQRLYAVLINKANWKPKKALKEVKQLIALQEGFNTEVYQNVDASTNRSASAILAKLNDLRVVLKQMR